MTSACKLPTDCVVGTNLVIGSVFKADSYREEFWQMFKVFLSVVAGLSTVSAIISQIKITQGLTPTTMAITWSSGLSNGNVDSLFPSITNCSSFHSLAYSWTGNTQIRYGTSPSSLNLLAQAGPGAAYTYQSFQAKARKAVAANITFGIKAISAIPAGALLPLYKSPIIHKAVLNNLLPGTKYYYQCGDITNNDLSAVISFTTLPAVGSARDADGQLLTFAIMADTSTTGVINGNMSAYLYA
jgi:hypothetical protein